MRAWHTDLGVQALAQANPYRGCDDPDGLYERASGRGAEVMRALKDEDYGSRSFTPKDPEGNVWTLGTYRGAEGGPSHR